MTFKEAYKYLTQPNVPDDKYNKAKAMIAKHMHSELVEPFIVNMNTSTLIDGNDLRSSIDKFMKDYTGDVDTTSFCESQGLSVYINNTIYKALHQLSPKEEYVIREKIKGRTLKSIGVDFGVSYERIRQLFAKGVHKLKHPIVIRSVIPKE